MEESCPEEEQPHETQRKKQSCGESLRETGRPEVSEFECRESPEEWQLGSNE